ncbi:hypothetical protein EU799_10505 [Corynebacterium silvaticum]|uniref:hypothetical protein n=1 Tax=Corynebacterium silvaticum TaxID=2320431 RepID=UPI001067C5B2|nr:hypothetical protein [Corynebacterium silvaticum]MBH5299872.1 hypothetical protein [Corynebacterium silvaticum]NOM65764.1 hypothetical protein [Corynebacterium silvaticum]TFA91576.1 hypothetical protein EU802_10485 [Corynebacterium silvaticum]TFA92562.1 hypothetical protein EU799_10505 [Corynebacterium silvaticum]TNX78703.1 hypothetical protein FIT55_10935 [Corynebacterium silvaticum]
MTSSFSESRVDKQVARVAPGSHLSGTAGTETGHGVRKALAHTPPRAGESGRVRGHQEKRCGSLDTIHAAGVPA